MSGIKIKDNFGPVLQGMIDNLQDNMQDATAKNAALLQARIVKKIRHQEENHAPLSENYLQSKRKKNSLILVNEGDYSNSFEMRKVKDGVYEVGTNAKQARVMEFGFAEKNIPARPHVQPAFDEVQDESLDNWKKAMEDSIKP